MNKSLIEVKSSISLQLTSLDADTSSLNMRNSIERLSNHPGKIYQSPNTSKLLVDGEVRDSFRVTIDHIGILQVKILLFCHEVWLDPTTRIDLMAGKKEFRPQGIWNCKHNIILSFFRSELSYICQIVQKIQPSRVHVLNKYLCMVSLFNIPNKSYQSDIKKVLITAVGPIEKITMKRMKNGSTYYSFIQFRSE